MIETIKHNGIEYPAFQASGNASRFIMPFAIEVCKGEGLDIGGNNKEWSFPDARIIDASHSDGYHAFNLPENRAYDYIFSSHCLEHVNDWAGALIYWVANLKKGGVLFLYLPDYSQTYWRPWHNRKHVNVLTPEIVKDCLVDIGMTKVYASGVDLNNSFCIIAEK
jgi:SAM-dependent methyltransferase